MFTEQELYDHLFSGADGRLQLPYDEACVLQKMLISHGYVVMISHGDYGDMYKVEWIYAGSSDNLDYANSSNVVFAHRDYLDMLYWKDYEKEEEDWIDKLDCKGYEEEK